MSFMDRLTGDAVHELGPAAMIPEEDVVYITEGNWMICVTGVQRHFSPQVLRVIEETARPRDSEYADWSLLCAQDIDYERRQYRPYKARKIRPFKASWNYSLTAESCRLLIEQQGAALYDQRHDLTAAFHAGAGRARYPDGTVLSKDDDQVVERAKGRIARTEDRASSYTFHIDNKVVSVSGPFLRAFTQIGFRLTMSGTLTGKNVPLIGANLEGDGTVFGFIAGMEDCVPKKSPDGRDIFMPVEAVCWLPVEQGEANILEDTSFFDPAGIRDIRTPVSQRLSNHATYEAPLVYKGVSILRWHGVPEDQIISLIESKRDRDLRHAHRKFLDRADRLLEELQRDSLSEWQVRSINNEAKRLCEHVETTSQLLCEDLALGALPDLVKAANARRK